MIKQRYQEASIIDNVIKYVDSTYEEHYQSKSIQLIDLFESEGMIVDYLKTSIMRYVLRYGKKSGLNVRDLYKAIHCIVLLIYFTTRIPNFESRPQLLQEIHSENI